MEEPPLGRGFSRCPKPMLGSTIGSVAAPVGDPLGLIVEIGSPGGGPGDGPQVVGRVLGLPLLGRVSRGIGEVAQRGAERIEDLRGDEE